MSPPKWRIEQWMSTCRHLCGEFELSGLLAMPEGPGFLYNLHAGHYILYSVYTIAWNT